MSSHNPISKQDLPKWSLADLYDGIASQQIVTDVDFCRDEAASLAKSFEGKIAGMDGASLAEMIARYEALSDKIGKLLSHADLNFATDLTSPEAGQHSQTLRENLASVFSNLLFVELELAAMDEAAYDAYVKELG